MLVAQSSVLDSDTRPSPDPLPRPLTINLRINKRVEPQREATKGPARWE